MPGSAAGRTSPGCGLIEADAQAGRVSLRYGSLAEWYRDTPAGIEQGFTLEQPPPGEGPVVLRLELRDTACGNLTEDGRGLRFAVGEAGTLHYDGLAAFDAAGRELEAGLACADGAILIRVDDRTAAYPLTVDPLIFLETKLTASDGADFDYFGRSVALSGDTALVGAAQHDVGGNENQGAAYVFVRSGGIWAQQAQLSAADGSPGDSFGDSVALSGNTAVVGAPWNDAGGSVRQGSAYVFVRSGTTWTQQAQLAASDGESSDKFGDSVAISGDTALVGASADAMGTQGDQGSAYVFVRSGTIWTQQAKLIALDGAGWTKLGTSVALSGDTALVGAPGDDTGVSPGSAYIFVRSGATWSQQAKLTAADGASSDCFGISVALSGDTALVGADRDNVGAAGDQGSAYVFVRSGTIWTQQDKITAADGGALHKFGASVALSGDTALIGAPGHGAGCAYIFVRSGAAWPQQAKLTASDGGANDKLGSSAALSRDTALVGALEDDLGPHPDPGSAYLFGIQPLRDLDAGAGASTTVPAVGSTVYLTAALTNYGPSDADDILVRAPLPGGLTHVASSASIGAWSPSGGSWEIAALAPGVTATVWIKATVDAGAAGKRLVFRVALSGTDSDPSNNTASVALAVPFRRAFASNGTQDGWVLESTERSGAGGSVSAGAAILSVGDDAVNRQYRAVLSFDTAGLPDNAVVRAATLRLRAAGTVGTNPFTTHGPMRVSLMRGAFSGNPALQPVDFQALPTLVAAGAVGSTPSGGWHSGTLAATALSSINRAGLTQLRLAFKRDDNDDKSADYLKFSSGNAGAASRPVLVVDYSLP